MSIEVSVACPWCDGTLDSRPCGERHAQLATEIELAPRLYAYLLGAIAEKERLAAANQELRNEATR